MTDEHSDIQNYLLFLPRVQTSGCAQCSGHWGFCCWWPLLCQQGSLGEELWARRALPSCVSEHKTKVTFLITGHNNFKIHIWQINSCNNYFFKSNRMSWSFTKIFCKTIITNLSTAVVILLCLIVKSIIIWCKVKLFL